MKARDARLKRTIWCFFLFVGFSNFATTLSFLTIYLQHIRFSIAAVSAFLLVYQMCKFSFEIPTGFLSDRYGRKVVGRVGLIGMVFYYALLLWHPSLFCMFVALAVRGISESCVSGSLESLFVDALPPDKLVQCNALERVCFYSANGASALLGGALMGAGLFKLSVAVDLVAAVVAFVASAGINGRREEEDNGIKDELPTLSKAVLSIGSNELLPSFLLMDFSQAFCFVGLEEFYTLVLQGNGFGPALSGMIIAVQLVATSLFGLIVPALARGGNRVSLLLKLALARLAMTALFLLPGLPFLCAPLFYFLGDLLFTLFAPIKYGLFQSACPPKYRATVISVQSQVTSLGAIAFFALSSFLSSAFDVQAVLLVALAMMSVLYVPALWRIASRCE